MTLARGRIDIVSVTIDHTRHLEAIVARGSRLDLDTAATEAACTTPS
jgi:hypothetical protein